MNYQRQSLNVQKGQAAIIAITVFIVIAVLLMGLSMSTQEKTNIDRIIYTEANLKTLYSAQAGLQEAIANRLVPRNNVYSIRRSTFFANSLLKEFFPSLAGASSLSSSHAKQPPVLHPESGILLSDPLLDPNDAGTIGSLASDPSQIVGAYVYVITGGYNTPAVGSGPADNPGMPGNAVNTPVNIYVTGYSELPNGNKDVVYLVAQLDMDRTDSSVDTINADEIEFIAMGESASGEVLSAINTAIADTSQPKVKRAVFYTPSQLNLDILESNSTANYAGTNSDGADKKIIPVGGADGGDYPSVAGVYTGTNLVDPAAQVRIFFNESVDPRSFSQQRLGIGTSPDTDPVITIDAIKDENGNPATDCSSNTSACRTDRPTEMNLAGFSVFPNLPMTDGLIVFPPANSTNGLSYGYTYELKIGNDSVTPIFDYYGNKTNGTTVIAFKVIDEPVVEVPTNTNTFTPTYTFTKTHTFTNTATFTNTSTKTNTLTNTKTLTSTKTHTFTNTPTLNATQKAILSFTKTPTPTNTKTHTKTATETNTKTFTSTITRTPTNTRTKTNTPTITYTPSKTGTATNTFTKTNTRTPTNTKTITNTPTITNTATITNTKTQTGTPTKTGTPTNTRTATNTGTKTNTPTITNTKTNTATPTNTKTPTHTGTPTNTSTKTNTATITNTPTKTPTITHTPTKTFTGTATKTPTKTNTPNLGGGG